jgi:hypothetical protein
LKEEERDGSRVCVCGGGLGFGLVWWVVVLVYGVFGVRVCCFFFFLMVGFKTLVKSLKPRDKANLSLPI